MKRIRVWTAVMALALTVSPFGALCVSAAEPGTVPTRESRANVPRPQVDVLGFADEWHLEFEWYSGSSQGSNAHIQILKDGEICYETVMKVGGSSGSLPLPFSRVIEESGSYQGKVWMETLDSSYICESETSEAVSYIRPEAVLGTTVGYWDEKQEGLFHYPAVKDAAGYTWRLLKYNDESGQWETKTQYRKAVREGIETDGVAYQGPRKSDSKDAGGEDKTRDFSDEIKWYGAGSYCVSVRALSGDITEIANGVEGEKSPVLIIGGNSDNSGSDDTSASDNTDGSDDSHQTGSFSLSVTARQIEQAKPGDTIKITKDQNIICLSNSDMKLLLERGDVTLEMEYTYEGVDYKIRISAGKAMNNDIPWYGPLYLAAHYSVGSFGTASNAVSNYTVQAGDSLSKIARVYKMTLKELAAKNPQIQNLDVISVGQKITIK